ncbi:MAG: ATP-binding cassette domain-containing protein [Clostridia bacterium]|nr:ATP-binding cassette domain-containing protein [Clostridia bacterium]
MLKLNDITKIYAEKTDSAVEALKGVSISFRKSEFVSILGQSGCGKTTLLNIIGGLDRYTDGDLIIKGKSTKDFKDVDWDTYRNHSIGFVFQSYNLIPHQTILENVELSMTLGGVPKAERRKRAKDALISVGLEEKMNKKPNELSGGQMQRVSIARALASEPDIILADEPTGALDTETSKSVMALLKEISKTKLVIMVTHNPELANEYSDRIIKMLDGNVIEDTKPYDGEYVETADDQKEVTYKKKNSSMNFLTALRLSGKNLISKYKRTIITSLAASIGIIGIAVILSVSSGMQAYIDQTMLDSTSFNFISISSTTTKMNFGEEGENAMMEYPENTTGVIPYVPVTAETKKQKLDDAFVSYLEGVCKIGEDDTLAVDISYTYNVTLNILTEKAGQYVAVSSSAWGESLHNADYLDEYYTVLAKDNNVQSAMPDSANEVALVVDSYNRLSTSTLDSLGIAYDSENLTEIKYSELIGKEFRVVFNDGWYTQDANGWYQGANVTNYADAYQNENGLTVKIVSVLREKKDAPASWLSDGIAYSPKLTEAVLSANKTSQVATAQVASPDINVTNGTAFEASSGGGFGGMFGGSTETYDGMLEKLGYTQTPTRITIYPIDVESREAIIAKLDEWNNQKKGTDAVVEYIDMSSMVTSILGTVVEIVTYVLMAFSIVSLVISSIMIAIIIYASVIERTKEIGVLRSMGARKKDVSRVFKAEAVILGISSGTIAILLTLVINVIINAILNNLVGVSTIASLGVGTAFALIALSTVLLLIASLIPASIAAKKEPAVALRTE